MRRPEQGVVHPVVKRSMIAKLSASIVTGVKWQLLVTRVRRKAQEDSVNSSVGGSESGVSTGAELGLVQRKRGRFPEKRGRFQIGQWEPRNSTGTC